MKNREYGFKCARTSRPNLAAGNGLFGCRDGAPKFAGKATELLQRQESGNWITENPGRNALFGVVPESCGLRRLDGGRTRARTWDPMIKSLQSSDLHSEVADCRTSQGVKLLEQEISRTR